MANLSDNAFEFKFDSQNTIPSEEVLRAEVATVGSTPEGDDATAQAADQSTAATSDATEAQIPAGGEPRTFKVKVDGEELEVSEEDLKSGHMRWRDYTQKTQKLAEQQRKWEAEVKGTLESKVQEYENELKALDDFLRDKEAVSAYMQKAFAQQQEAVKEHLEQNTQLTPDVIARIARQEAQQAQDQALRKVANELARREQAFVQSQQAAQQRQHLETEINAHLETIFEKFPALKEYDGIEDELMADAAKRMTSRDVGEAKKLLVDAAERKMAWAKSIATVEKKKAAVAAEKLTKNGIEPPGGTGIKPTGGRKLTLDSKDRNDFINETVAEMTAMMKARQ